MDYEIGTRLDRIEQVLILIAKEMKLIEEEQTESKEEKVVRPRGA